MLDGQMDAVYPAWVGYGGVDIVVAETGWSSAGDSNQFGSNLDNAISCISNLVKHHLCSGFGTPLMLNRTFEVNIFSLFHEELKPESAVQRPLNSLPGVKLGSQEMVCTKGALQANIDFFWTVVDCNPIQVGGRCFEPNNIVICFERHALSMTKPMLAST